MTLIYQVQPTSSGWNRTLNQRHAASHWQTLSFNVV